MKNDKPNYKRGIKEQYLLSEEAENRNTHSKYTIAESILEHMYILHSVSAPGEQLTR